MKRTLEIIVNQARPRAPLLFALLKRRIERAVATEREKKLAILLLAQRCHGWGADVKTV